MGLVNVLEVVIFYTLSRLLALGCRDTVVFGGESLDVLRCIDSGKISQ